MKHINLKELLTKYSSGEASPDERRIVEKWLEEARRPVTEWTSMDDKTQAAYVQNLYNAVQEAIHQPRPPRANEVVPRRGRYRFAAMTLVITGLFLLYSLFHHRQAGGKNGEVNSLAEMNPAPDSTILTLGNGERVLLGHPGLKDLPAQGNVRLSAKCRELSYNARMEGVSQTGTNTIATSAGGGYKVVLSEGTKVWLNAASSLTFPVPFQGNSRRVELSGEGYFEVSPDPLKPFIVETGKGEVMAVGTRFDISAYQKDSCQETTLLEGTLIFSIHGSTHYLKPGEQLCLSAKGIITRKNAIDTSRVLRWKNIFFHIHEKQVMVSPG